MERLAARSIYATRGSGGGARRYSRPSIKSRATRATSVVDGDVRGREKDGGSRTHGASGPSDHDNFVDGQPAFHPERDTGAPGQGFIAANVFKHGIQGVIEAATAGVIVALTVGPLVAYAMYEAIDRFAPTATWRDTSTSIAIGVSIVCLCTIILVFSCINEFPPGSRHLHPMWASPRLVLFLEIHPIFGGLVPLTSFLRGYPVFALVRWILNAVAMYLWLVGRAILQPAYREACCYGKDFLDGTESDGSCESREISVSRGFHICDDDFLSETHKSYLSVAAVLLTISCSMQLANIMTVDWDIVSFFCVFLILPAHALYHSPRRQVNRIGQIQREMKRRLENPDDISIRQQKILPIIQGVDKNVTIDIRLVMERMGLDDRLMGICFPGYTPTKETWGERMHHHPQWAHTGLLRLLMIDPIFGFLLSTYDFVSFFLYYVPPFRV